MKKSNTKQRDQQMIGIAAVCSVALFITIIALLSQRKTLSPQIVFASVSTSTSMSTSTASSITLLPAYDGLYRVWTSTSGTAHYVTVDEPVCNGTTDYVTTNAGGARDSYGLNLSGIPNGSIITAIQITPCASRIFGGSAYESFDVFFRYGLSLSPNKGAYALPYQNNIPANVATTTFSGLSLLKNATSTLEIGAMLSTAKPDGIRLSRLSAVVTYTLPTGSTSTASVPAAPSSVFAMASSTSAIISWSESSANVNGFRIERSADSLHFLAIATTTANVMRYADNGHFVTSTYTYRLQAFNSVGYSPYSSVASVSFP